MSQMWKKSVVKRRAGPGMHSKVYIATLNRGVFWQEEKATRNLFLGEIQTVILKQYKVGDELIVREMQRVVLCKSVPIKRLTIWSFEIVPSRR